MSKVLAFKQENQLFLFLYLIWFLNQINRYVIPPLLPLLIDEFKLSLYQAGLLVSGTLVIYIIFQTPAGVIADRYGRKLWITLGCLVFSATFFLTGFAKGFKFVLFLRGVTGWGDSFHFSPAISIINQTFPSEKRGRAISFFMTGPYVAMVIGPLVAAPIADMWGWRATCFIFGGIGLILPLFWPDFKESGKMVEPEANESQRFLHIVTCRDLNIISLVSFFNLFAISFNVFVPTYLVTHFGMGLVDAGIIATICPFVGFLSSLAGGIASDKMNRYALLRTSLFLSSIFFGLLYIFAEKLIPFIIILAAIGLTRGMLVSIVVSITSDIIKINVKGKDATAFAYSNTVGFGGGALGPGIIGLILDKTTFSNLLLFFTFTFVVCFVISYRIHHNRGKLGVEVV
jgi:MFS family permease